MERHLDTLDPVTDEPSLRLLTQIVERQRRHIAELGGATTATIEDVGALPIDLKEKRELTIMERLH
jgi:hypothetical protein